MNGVRIDHGLDRRRMAGGPGIGQIALDLRHRQIVVLAAEQQQHRRSGIGAALGDYAEGAGRDRKRHARQSGPVPERAPSEASRTPHVRHFGAEREAEDGDVSGVDPRLVRQTS